MQESKYNFFVHRNDSVICFNGLSHAVFKIDEEGYGLLKNVLLSKKAQEQYPSICEKLHSYKFLVDSNQVEIEFLKEKYLKSKHSDTFHLIINPTQNCNFNCWYCYEKHPKGYMSEDVFERAKKCIRNIICSDEINKFSLGWFGGEPLMYFDKRVYPLSIYAKEKAEEYGVKFVNTMTTNGYLLNERMIERCHEIGLNFMQITIDGDKEIHDRIRNEKGKPSFDKILNNCIKYCLFSNQNQILLRINYTDESLKVDYGTLLDIIPIEIRAQIKINFQRVWQTYSDESNRNQTELHHSEKRVKDLNFKLSASSLFSLHQGCVCYADRSNYVNLNYDGNLYRCTARDYNLESSYGILGDEGELKWNVGKLKNIDDKPYFDNPKCLSCKYLAICGGPCFSRMMGSLNNSEDLCDINMLDSNVEHFITEYYESVHANNKR